jgi:arginyl-tRNA--protein-N-Asp/Glu arginylyltransferase
MSVSDPSANNRIGDEESDPLRQLAFYASQEHPCSYLDGRRAVTLFADPSASMDMPLYSRLAELGFRRSGNLVYRPQCPQCRACMPARIPVNQFKPNRAQRRTLQANAQTSTVLADSGFSEEHFALYRRYMSVRHAGGGMDDPDPEKYRDFLCTLWARTEFVEFWHEEQLMAVAVLDVMSQGLSSVYTFFDPRFSALSPGRYAILWSIQETQRRGLPWLYLGYWIGDCDKMRYKQEYRPLELRINNQWQAFAGGENLPEFPPKAD